MTIVALLKYTRLRKHATTAFVISLSISDLIFSAVNLPLTASRYLNEAWVLGETLCQIFPLFFYGNVAVSLLSMVAITINRFVTKNLIEFIQKVDFYEESTFSLFRTDLNCILARKPKTFHFGLFPSIVDQQFTRFFCRNSLIHSLIDLSR